MFEKLARRWFLFRFRHTKFRYKSEVVDDKYQVVWIPPAFAVRYFDKREIDVKLGERDV